MIGDRCSRVQSMYLARMTQGELELRPLLVRLYQMTCCGQFGVVG
jgi:hypothetical protein